MAVSLLEMDEPDREAQSWVYVIGAESSAVVKIGKASNVKKRLYGIQTSNPNRLVVRWQTPGGVILEGRLHERFKHLRLEGEWFDFGTLDPVETIRVAVEELTGRSATPVSAVRQPAAPAREPEWDTRWPRPDDPDRDDPEYQPQSCGCRLFTPTELAANGYGPDEEVLHYTRLPLPGGVLCHGAH